MADATKGKGSGETYESSSADDYIQVSSHDNEIGGSVKSFTLLMFGLVSHSIQCVER